MNTAGLCDASPLRPFLVSGAGAVSDHGAVGMGTGEEPSLGSIKTPIVFELPQEAHGKECITVFAAFTLFDSNLFSLAVDVARLESDDLANTETCPVDSH